MTITRRSILRAAGSIAALPALPARAQQWPSRTIRILVGTAAGGSPDIVSRVLGEKLSERFGQTVIVDGAFLLKAEAEKAEGGGDHHDH